MTATPPASLAIRSWSFSRSKSDGGRLDLSLDLLDAALDLRLVAVALDDRGVVLGGDDAAGATEILDRGAIELAADLFGDDGAAGQDGDVAQHLLAAIAEAGGLDGQDVDRAAQLVDDQRRQRLAVDVLGDDQEALGDLQRLLEHRQEVGDGRDLLVGDQDHRVVEDGFHALGVGDEVRRDVAAVDLHALGVLGLELQTAGLLDGDDAVACRPSP
ncbi:MAG: hypothetical protein V9F06_00875 [Thermomicrobiales bacterium]